MTSYKPKLFPFPRPFMITPSVGVEVVNPYFLNAAQQLVDAIIPESIWLLREVEWESLLFQLVGELPIFMGSDLDDDSTSFTISYLCPARPSVQTQKYIRDMIIQAFGSVEFVGNLNLCFRFVQDSSMQFLVGQETIAIRSMKENLSIRKKAADLLGDLKRRLPRETFRQPNVVHPIFMPRNEEEMIRNLILLASQIKYVKDLPQVSIHYEKQTDVDLTFTVIAASLLKGKKEPLRKKLERSNLKLDIDLLRVMGYLLQKYPKETAIFHITIDKQPFFRADHSVDLLRARQKIALEVHHLLGEFRDFNGGMILKQDEALKQLARAIGPMSKEKEFLLENYFYALKPAISQTIHDPELLKSHFEQLIHLKDLSIKKTEKFLTIFALCERKEPIFKAIEPLQLSAHDLTHCTLELREKTAVGFILRVESEEMAKKLEFVIRNAL